MADTLRTDALDRGTDADLLPSLYAAIESANDAVIIFDCTSPSEPYLFRYVNRMFEIQTGFSREEVLGRPAKMLFGADTDVNLLAVWRAELHKGRAMKGEVLKYRKNGTAFWCEVNMRRVSDGPGAYHVISIQRDISARKKHEQRLEQTRSILGAVVENTSAAIYACDLSGRLLLANERFAAVAGIAREKLAGRKTDSVLPLELASMIRRNNERALAAQTAVVDEERVRDAAVRNARF